MGLDEDDASKAATISQFNKSSPLTEKRRQRHRMYARRCARVMVGFVVLVALSIGVIYLIANAKGYESIVDTLHGFWTGRKEEEGVGSPRKMMIIQDGRGNYYAEEDYAQEDHSYGDHPTMMIIQEGEEGRVYNSHRKEYLRRAVARHGGYL